MGLGPPHDEPMVLIAVGGDPELPVHLPDAVPAGSVVVAADSGLDRLVLAGLAVDHVVGDLDSARPELVVVAEAAGAAVHRHPADKDATDLELALSLVRDVIVPAVGVRRLLVVGAGGGRLDHLVGDLLLLASPITEGLEVTARLGDATVAIVRPEAPRRVGGAVGEVLSILPVHGAAAGVTTTGVRWPLVDADLVAGTTRALSNELTAAIAEISVSSGVLAVVLPGTAAAAVAPRATPYDPTPRARGGPP